MIVRTLTCISIQMFWKGDHEIRKLLIVIHSGMSEDDQQVTIELASGGVALKKMSQSLNYI